MRLFARQGMLFNHSFGDVVGMASPNLYLFRILIRFNVPYLLAQQEVNRQKAKQRHANLRSGETQTITRSLSTQWRPSLPPAVRFWRSPLRRQLLIFEMAEILGTFCTL
jgi:hypothetical protein